MDKRFLNKSLEEIENDFWSFTKFPTPLVEKCFYARKKKLKNLDLQDIRLLTTQGIGLPYIIPMSLKILQNNLMIDSGIYEGDLLESLLRVPSSFWRQENSKTYLSELIKLLSEKEKIIANTSSITEEIKNDILNAYSNFKMTFSRT